MSGIRGNAKGALRANGELAEFCESVVDKDPDTGIEFNYGSHVLILSRTIARGFDLIFATTQTIPQLAHVVRIPSLT